MKTALIIGAGPGISFSFGKKLVETGYRVALASRNQEKLTPLCDSIGATPFFVDCSSSQSVVDLFANFEAHYATSPHVVLYNTSAGRSTAGECGTVDYAAAAADLNVAALNAFVACQEAGKRMIPRGEGAIFLTGATAGVKAFPTRAVFAMGTLQRH